MLRRSPIATCTLLLLLWAGTAGSSTAPIAASDPASASSAAPAITPICPRPQPGGTVEDPEDVRSQNGLLKLDLTVRNETLPDGRTRYCYLLPDGHQSPTLRVKPGDLLILNLKNELTEPASAVARTTSTSVSSKQIHAKHTHAAHSSSDPCSSAVMSAASANLHFHGLTVPPVCHQDEVLRTSIQPGDPPFEYRFRIPANEPPGLYWYHPHIHGFSSMQVQGGASGALIVEGIERAAPEVAGLPERVLVIRDQDLASPNATSSSSGQGAPSIPDRDGDAVNTGTGGGKPAKDLSVNFVPVPYPDYPLATVRMKPGEKQLWRVLNASSLTYLDLTLLYKYNTRFRPQWLGLVAIDGVPVNGNGSPSPAVRRRNSIVLSPGSRVEFILTGPPAGVPAVLATRSVNTGETGENDPDRGLLSIVTSDDAPEPNARLSTATEPLPAPSQPWLGSVTPTRTRKLFFSEEPVDPKNPNGPTRFYLTVDGETPKVFDPTSTEPDIVAHQGDVEDWIIENRSTELHAFHIHQVHFQVVEWAGLQINEPFLRDTINVPFYNLSMPHFPTVRLRMDFRDPNTIGTFVYHCHLLEHEDNGMMGLIRVEPAVQERPEAP